jgi:hypothetical protein
MKKATIFCLCISFLVLALTPVRLFSNVSYWSTMKFELSTGVSFEKAVLDSSYFHQYSPPFLSGAYVSDAQQTIHLNGQTGWGISAAFAYMFLKNLGLELQFEYGKPEITGKNSPYDVYLNYALSYDAGPPPYPYVFERSFGWPNTEGYLTELCLSLDLIGRLPLSNKISFSLSGGLTYFNVKGEGTGLAYAKYWWEEGWFNGETYQYKFNFGPLNKLGLNLGLEFNLVLYSRFCFVMDLRYYSCPKTTLGLDIINEGLIPDDFNQIKATMNLHDITIDPSFYRVNVGLKYLF